MSKNVTYVNFPPQGIQLEKPTDEGGAIYLTIFNNPKPKPDPFHASNVRNRRAMFRLVRGGKYNENK